MRGSSAKGWAPQHERVELVDRDLVVGADRDDLLGEHVERVPGDGRLLDRALAHRLRDDGALEQVRAELREDPALRDRPELVAGATDALEASRDRLRALDLHDEVDRPHVDPELEARRRDEARDAAGLEVLLDQDALLARQGPVVCAGHGSAFMGTTGVRSASSLMRSASRSARRRLLTNTIVERCARTSSRSAG